MTNSIADSTIAAWTVLEHVRTAKRWRDEDLEWIKFTQELTRESLVALIGEDKAMKAISNSRIALRKRQAELKQQRNEELTREVAEVDKITSDPLTENERGRSK